MYYNQRHIQCSCLNYRVSMGCSGMIGTICSSLSMTTVANNPLSADQVDVDGLESAAATSGKKYVELYYKRKEVHKALIFKHT